MSITTKIIKNVFSSWIYYFVQFGVGFFLMPFMVHKLGIETYGIWILIMSLTGYMGFLEFGLRGSIVKHISEFEAKNDFEGINKLINTGLLTYIVGGLFVIVLTFIASKFIYIFLNINHNYLIEFQASFKIMGINLGFFLFFLIFAGILEGFKRQDIISGIETVAFILQSLCIVYCIKKGGGIVAVAMSMLGVNILKQIVRMIFVFTEYPMLSLNKKFLSIKYLRILFNYSAPLFTFTALRDYFLVSLPNVILGIFSGPLAVTFYSVASRLNDYIKVLLSTTTSVLIPFISRFEALNDKTRLVKSFVISTKYCYVLIVFACLSLIFYGKEFLGLWMGVDFVINSYPVLFVITLVTLFTPSAFTVLSLLKGVGRFKELVILTVVEICISGVISVLLFNKIGVIGIAISFSLFYFINYGLLLPALVLNVLQVSFWDYVKNVYLKVSIPAIILSVFMISLKHFYALNSYFSLVTSIILSGIIYSVTIFLFMLEKSEKEFYFFKLKTKFIALAQ